MGVQVAPDFLSLFRSPPVSSVKALCDEKPGYGGYSSALRFLAVQSDRRNLHIAQRILLRAAERVPLASPGSELFRKKAYRVNVAKDSLCGELLLPPKRNR